MKQNNLYPPSQPYIVRNLAVGFTSMFLIFLVSVTYGYLLKPSISTWLALILAVGACLAIGWFARFQQRWEFRWRDTHILVRNSYNVLFFTKEELYIDSRLVAVRRGWATSQGTLEAEIVNEEKRVEIKATIDKIGTDSDIGCSISVEGQFVAPLSKRPIEGRA